jgi:uncharacterized protein
MKRVLKFTTRLVLLIFILLNIITAFHAYKFTHFYDATEAAAGTLQKKSGLAIASDILFGIKAYKQHNMVLADSVCQTVYLTTKDHVKLEAWYIKHGNTARGTVILFHGHGSKKSSVLEEAYAFKKMGFNTLLVDFTAHGSSGGNTCTIGYNEAEDVKLAYDFIQQSGEKNIVLWGISMGAATISKAIADYPLQPAKIILEMPFASILQAAEGRIKMMGLPGQPLATLITFWGGVEHGFWAFSMKPAAFVQAIKCPVLLQWGRNDARVQQSETDLIYANIATPKKLVIYENSGHESLCENEHDKWVKEVGEFLEK